MRNTKNSLKAVSPIIALLLVLVITVAVALIFYLWITGYISSTKRPYQGYGIIKIEGIKYNGSDSQYLYYLLWIRYIGEYKINVTGVYFIDPATGTVVYKTQWTGIWTIEPYVPNFLWISIPKGAVERGKEYIVKVIAYGPNQAPIEGQRKITLP